MTPFRLSMESSPSVHIPCGDGIHYRDESWGKKAKGGRESDQKVFDELNRAHSRHLTSFTRLGIAQNV
jgi:hypothetical protein